MGAWPLNTSAFRFRDWTPLHHPLTFSEPGSLGHGFSGHATHISSAKVGLVLLHSHFLQVVFFGAHGNKGSESENCKATKKRFPRSDLNKKTGTWSSSGSWFVKNMCRKNLGNIDLYILPFLYMSYIILKGIMRPHKFPNKPERNANNFMTGQPTPP